MVERSAPVVIVGGGQAGASAAITLRRIGHEGPLSIISAEPHPPYERPPLSKQYLRGEKTVAQVSIEPREWYADHGVDLRLDAAATGVDLAARTVTLAGGERLAYGALLVATGGRPRHLTADDDHVLYLRSLADADQLRSRLFTGGHLVVIGAGFIGAEVAASARALGVQVTLLELLDVPLAGVVGVEIGELLAEIHRENGVVVRTGEGVTAVEHHGGGLTVRTTREAVIECDVVVAGVGIEPCVELMRDSGVQLDNGIVVDAGMRTAVDSVFAAGDVARHHHPLLERHVRVEHFDTANRQGAVAARNIAGEDAVFSDPHWFWSDQYSYTLQMVGTTAEHDEVVTRGAVSERRFCSYHLRGGRLIGALALNAANDVLVARRMIARGLDVAPHLLRDQGYDLRQLLRTG